MIKPEFWISDDITSCSIQARLLFVGLWNFCDDNGVHPHNVRTIKMEVYPGDNFCFEDIETMITELVDNDLLIIFDAGGREYLKVKNWNKHQRIDRPKNKYPDLSSGKIVGPKEQQPKVKELAPVPAEVITDDCERFVAYLNSRLMRNYHATDKLKRQFKARLKDGFKYVDFERALENAIANEFHQKNQCNYLTPEFFTYSEKLQKWINAKPITINNEEESKPFE